MLGGVPYSSQRKSESANQGYSIWGLPQPLAQPSAAANGGHAAVNGTWGSGWAAPAQATVSVEAQAPVAHAPPAAWSKASAPQSLSDAVPGLCAGGLGGGGLGGGLGAALGGGATDVLPGLDAEPGARLPSASPKRSPGLSAVGSPLAASASSVGSPLCMPAVPSGPLPGALPPSKMATAGPVALGAGLGAMASLVGGGAIAPAAPAAGEGRLLVRCKGLPFSATAASVASFFEPLDIVAGGVHLQLNADGVPNGECYVEFASSEALAAGLQRNRQVMGHRYVAVQRVGGAEAERLAAAGSLGAPPAPAPAPALARAVAPAAAAQKVGAAAAVAAAVAVAGNGTGGSGSVRAARPGSAAGRERVGHGASAVPPSGDGGSAVVVKMRGLPYSASDEQIADFFSGLRIAPNGVSIGRDAGGRPSGEAHVEFCSDNDAQAAMAFNRQRMSAPGGGSRYIELFRTKQLSSGARGRSAAAGDAAVAASGGGADSLRLRGMPFHSTEADVSSFFKGYSIAAGGIKLGPQGGHGHVRFASVEEARRALVSLNHSYMGNRYIELFWAS